MRWLGIALMFLGALVGGATAYGTTQLVRSDDWVLGRSAVANPNGERVVITSYGETTFDSDLRITATPEADTVFIGTAHPVDVADYTATVAHARISIAPLSAPHSISIAGASHTPPGVAKNMDFWNEKVSGTGPQSMTLSAGAAPSQIVIVAASDGPVTVRVDYHVNGIRRLIISVLAGAGALFLLGLILLVIGVVRRVRRRRTPPGPSAPVQPEPLPAPPAEPPVAGPPAAWRVLAGALAVTLLVTATGCSVPRVPARVAPEPAPAKQPLTMAQAHIAELDLSDRMIAANKAAFAPDYSTDAWKTIYTGFALREAAFTTIYAKAAEDKTPSPACSIYITDVYGSVAERYPMTTTVVSSWRCGAEVAARYFLVLTRDHSYSPWLIAANAQLVEGLPPVSGAGTVSSADQDAGSVSAKKVVDYINSGNAADVVLSAPLKDFYTDSTAKTASSTHAVKATIPDVPGAVQVNRTTKGTITTVAILSTVLGVANKGYVIWWPKPLDTVLNQPGERLALAKEYVCFATILVEGDKTYIVGWDAGLVV